MNEYEATKLLADRKAEEIAQKGQDMTNEDLLNLCTLNILRDKANKALQSSGKNTAAD